MTDDLELRRRRAAYRASHRGTKEMDVLLGKFAAHRLPSLSADEMTRFEEFIALQDPMLQKWIFAGHIEGAVGPAHPMQDIVDAIRAFHGLPPAASGANAATASPTTAGPSTSGPSTSGSSH